MHKTHYTVSVTHTCDACSKKQTVTDSADSMPPLLPTLPPNWKRVRITIADGKGIVEDHTSEYCDNCHPVIDV